MMPDDERGLDALAQADDEVDDGKGREGQGERRVSTSVRAGRC